MALAYLSIYCSLGLPQVHDNPFASASQGSCSPPLHATRLDLSFQLLIVKYKIYTTA